MQQCRYLVFDLDGTISDPAVGILRSLNYALDRFGFPGVNEAEVSRFIGPPLDLTIREITGLTSDDEIAELVRIYRERYGVAGYAENTLYPGIYETVRYLASHDAPMGVCTSKRADFAEKILEVFHIRNCFTFVSGGDIGIHKDEQLHILLEDNMIDTTAFMIGDRAIDIQAAHAVGICSAGVLWGYGSKKELLDASPEFILEQPEQLKEWYISMNE
ncbi:MAG: HAD hydrolase-like protein [Methanospirillum sp.]|nr:HAD hydrolase-like protein [Methanospirillum sp.]